MQYEQPKIDHAQCVNSLFPRLVIECAAKWKLKCRQAAEVEWIFNCMIIIVCYVLIQLNKVSFGGSFSITVRVK